eukprot:540720-Prorocentrum_minimum.AAC.1
MYSMKKAMSGSEAMQILKELPYFPDLILLDVMMPGMNGFEVKPPPSERLSDQKPNWCTPNERTKRTVQLGHLSASIGV